ncbi:kinase-like domain-containing protein [Mycena floridula]|nr:kinase-like domain-containing protein [Mycena floridula]
MKKEATVWRRVCGHENIVQFYGVCLMGGRPTLVLPWYNNETASKYLLGKDLKTKLDFIRGIARGVKHLHHHRVVHGDIKGSNILVTDEGKAALSDFGLSRAMDQSTGFTTSSHAGSIPWQAPELFNMFNHRRTFASDIWALGCTVYELITEHKPYGTIKDQLILSRRVSKGLTPLMPTDHIIHDCHGMPELLRDCWSMKVSSRLTIDQFMSRLSSI